MMAFALSFQGAMLVMGAALLASTAASAFGQDTLPTTPPPPASVKYSPPSHKEPLGTTFIDWDKMTVRTTPTGQSRGVWDNPTPDLEKFEMHITTLRGGMISHPVHHHSWEEMLLVKEGNVEVQINGKKYQAGPGALIFYASHDPHNIKNAGTTLATYYVMNFYTGLVHTTSDKPAIEQAVPGKLQSTVIDCDRLPATETAIGSTTKVVDSPTLTFPTLSSHITMLNFGMSTKSDIIDTGDELFILKTGEIDASVNGVTHHVTAGSFFYVAPGEKRTFKNTGTTPAAYQVIKVVSDKRAQSTN